MYPVQNPPAALLLDKQQHAHATSTIIIVLPPFLGIACAGINCEFIVILILISIFYGKQRLITLWAFFFSSVGIQKGWALGLKKLAKSVIVLEHDSICFHDMVIK